MYGNPLQRAQVVHRCRGWLKQPAENSLAGGELPVGTVLVDAAPCQLPLLPAAGWGMAGKEGLWERAADGFCSSFLESKGLS